MNPMLSSEKRKKGKDTLKISKSHSSGKKGGTMKKSDTSLGLFVSPDLSDLVDRRRNNDRLHQRLEATRSLFRMLKGFMPPEITCAVSDSLQSNSYIMTIDGGRVDGGIVPPTGSLILDIGGGEHLKGFDEIYESFTGLPCLWTSSDLPEDRSPFFELEGIDIIGHHFFQLMYYCPSHLFDKEAFTGWKDHPHYPSLGEIFSGAERENLLYETLKVLLSMRFSIVDRNALIEEFRHLSIAPSDQPRVLAERVRQIFARRRHREFTGRKDRHFLYLDDDLTGYIHGFMRSEQNLTALLHQKQLVSILHTLGKALFPIISRHEIPVLVCRKDIRQFVELITMQLFPELLVLSPDEAEGLEPDDLSGTILLEHRKGAESINPLAVEALRWSKSRFSYFMSRRQKGSPFYHVAPLKPDRFWLESLQSIFLFLDSRAAEAAALIDSARKIMPSHFIAHHIKGEQSFMRGRQDEALSIFRKAWEAEPCYPDILGERARGFLRDGNLPLSRKLLQSCLALDPDNSGNQAMLAEILRAEGDAENAKKALEKALLISPQNYRAWRLLAWIHFEEGDHGKAEDCFKSLLSRAPDDPPGRYGLGMIYFHHKRLKEAEWEFYRALQSDPDMDRAHYRLAWIHMQEGKFSLAEQKFHKALELSPDRAEFALGLGALYVQEKSYTQACELFKRALRSEPGNVKARESLAETYWEMGQEALALEEYRRLAFFDPEEVTYRFAAGLLLIELGNSKEALRELRWSQRHLPDFIPALEAYGWALITAGQPQKAIEAFKKAIALHPGHHGFLYGLGVAYFHRHDYENAASMMKKSLGENTGWSHYMLSRISSATGRLEEALEYISKARKVYPHNPAFNYEEADLLFKKGALREALEGARAVTSSSPEHWLAHLLCGRIEKAMGTPGSAEIQWRRALTLFPHQGAFYGELFFLYEEEGDYGKMNDMALLMKQALPMEPMTHLLDLLLKLDYLELEEAEKGFSALKGEKRHRAAAYSYLALISFLKNDFTASYNHMCSARRERGDSIMRDSYIGELFSIRGKADHYEAQCRDYLKKHGDDPQVMRAFAEFCMKRGAFRKTLKVMQKVLTRGCRVPRAHAIMAETHLRRGKFTNAEAMLKEGIRLFPRNPELHAKLGQLYFEWGFREGGERSFRLALSYSPERIAGMYLLNLLGYRGNWEELLEQYGRLPELLQKWSSALSMAALALAQLKRYDEALENLAQAEVHLADPYDQAEIAYFRATIHWLKDSPEKAIKSLIRAKKLSPGSGNARLAGAFLHYLRGRLKEAATELAQARKKRPAWAEAFFLTGLVVTEEGNRRKGTYYLQKALHLFPNNTLYREWLEKVRDPKNVS
jgi:tetratricopeptide (TPR) repeat protein